MSWVVRMNKIMQCERHVGRKIRAGVPVSRATQKQLTSEASSDALGKLEVVL